MTTLNSTTHTLPCIHTRSGSQGWLASAFATLRGWITRSHARDELGEMDERLLNDIGLTRADVAAEADKFFWQR
jgi:uncharacterized protein YjiS (DUF1127 family)